MHVFLFHAIIQTTSFHNAFPARRCTFVRSLAVVTDNMTYPAVLSWVLLVSAGMCSTLGLLSGLAWVCESQGLQPCPSVPGGIGMRLTGVCTCVQPYDWSQLIPSCCNAYDCCWEFA